MMRHSQEFRRFAGIGLVLVALACGEAFVGSAMALQPRRERPGSTPPPSRPEPPSKPKPPAREPPKLAKPVEARDAADVDASTRELAGLASFGVTLNGRWYYAGMTGDGGRSNQAWHGYFADRCEFILTTPDVGVKSMAAALRQRSATTYALGRVQEDFGATPEKSIAAFREGVMWPGIWYAWSAQDDYDRWRGEREIAGPNGQKYEVDSGPFAESGKTRLLAKQFADGLARLLSGADASAQGAIDGMIMMARIRNEDETTQVWRETLLPKLRAAAGPEGKSPILKFGAPPAWKEGELVRLRRGGEFWFKNVSGKTLRNVTIEIEITTGGGLMVPWYAFFHELASGAECLIAPPTKVLWMTRASSGFTGVLRVHSPDASSGAVSAELQPLSGAEPARHQEFVSTMNGSMGRAVELTNTALGVYGYPPAPTTQKAKTVQMFATGSRWVARDDSAKPPLTYFVHIKGHDAAPFIYDVEIVERSGRDYTFDMIGQLVEDSDRGAAIGMRFATKLLKNGETVRDRKTGKDRPLTAKEIAESNGTQKNQEMYYRTGKIKFLTSPFDNANAPSSGTDPVLFALALDQAGRPTLQIRYDKVLPLVPITPKTP